jgi:hypothetical protein
VLWRAGAGGGDLVAQLEHDLGQEGCPLYLYLVGEVRGVHSILASHLHTPTTSQVPEVFPRHSEVCKICTICSLETIC